SLLLDPLADENVVANHRKLTEEEKRAKLRKIFSSSCSNGNLEKVVSMLKNVRSYIDINAQDEDGITPLIYAACFGHGKIAETLLEAGSKVDIKDKSKYQKEKEKRGFVGRNRKVDIYRSKRRDRFDRECRSVR